jgi:predicted alpha/beta superfamily hydrolase
MFRNSNIKMTNYFISVLFLITLIISNCIAQNKIDVDPFNITYPEVTILYTELRTIYSDIMNEDLNIYIKLPVNYYSDSSQIYPVWYWTDANRAFPILANISSILGFPKTDFPDIIIVSIGYPVRDMADWTAWRTRDLTPTNDPGIDSSLFITLEKLSGRKYDIKSGGASLFLEFIIKELIPYIESNYRVSSSDRGLGGYSYGGIFVLNALFKHPETFSRYFAGSPSLWYDNGILFQYENEYALTHKDLNAKIFISAGGKEDDEMLENVKKMTDQLQSRNYPGLKLESYIFPDENHRSCIPAALMRAFRVLYKE